ncbi:MAG: DNA-directed RNA polymerase subunit omega [Clostridiales bacterium]|jgi:DNA-directed RNA polymerase subunit omega|nr:DNA-directed RNA polymerase subunit omega [Clostridiales bacterium]
MLRPSYSELMESLNNDMKVDSQITSRYTIVLATAKRARQIIDGANPLTYAPTDRAVSIAVRELAEGKLLIKVDPEVLENPPEKTAASMYFKGMSSVSKDDLREDFKDNYDRLDRRMDDEDDEDGYKEPDYKDDDYKDDDYKDTAYKDDAYMDDEESDPDAIDEYPQDDFDDE